MSNALDRIKAKLYSIPRILKENTTTIKKLLPILSFAIPLTMLYILYPASFEKTWKGRTYYLFFLWLFSLETIVDWEKLQAKGTEKLRSKRTIAFILAFILPTTYVILANFYGLNEIIVDFARKNNVQWADWMPLSTEYLVFMVLFTAIVLLIYGLGGLKTYPISMIFLAVIGVIYTIDNMYPYGRFTPFQLLVPTTTTLAAHVLNMMGYQTSIVFSTNPNYGYLPYLTAFDPNAPTKFAIFGIAWPCAGIESLIIYTLTISLFLKRSNISLKIRFVYFIVGALITYFINILRIVSIFLIQMNGGDWRLFHDVYGQLYSIAWISCYPLIILGMQALWEKRRLTKKLSQHPLSQQASDQLKS